MPFKYVEGNDGKPVMPEVSLDLVDQLEYQTDEYARGCSNSSWTTWTKTSWTSCAEDISTSPEKHLCISSDASDSIRLRYITEQPTAAPPNCPAMFPIISPLLTRLLEMSSAELPCPWTLLYASNALCVRPMAWFQSKFEPPGALTTGELEAAGAVNAGIGAAAGGGEEWPGRHDGFHREPLDALPPELVCCGTGRGGGAGGRWAPALTAYVWIRLCMSCSQSGGILQCTLLLLKIATC